MTVKHVKLGDVAEFIRGITFTPQDVLDDFANDSVAVMRTKNVQETIDLEDVWKINESFVKNEKQYLFEGDLLVSSANSWNLVGKASWIPKLEYKSTFGGFVTVLRGDENKINKRYLYYWFVSRKIQAMLRSFSNKTTNISNLNLKRSLELSIPLPPLAEQKRIAELLDTADRIIRLRELAIAKLDELIASKYDEMFASHASNENACLGECLRFINGRAYSQHELLDEGTPIIRIQNLNGGNRWYYSNLNLPADKYCTNGDLLFAWSATFGPYIWTGDKSIYHYHIWKIEPSKMIHKTFAYYLLQNITQKIKSASHGASMLHMTKAGMEAWKFHLPSIERQTEFASIANSIESTKATYSDSNARIKTLFSSLQHQSFAVS